jgi:thiol-disulfide isomerase/thioredoxin
MEMKRLVFSWLCFLLFGTACNAAQEVHPGAWQGTFFLNDSTTMPFRFEVNDTGFVFVNATERIVANEITRPGDSVFVVMPVFDSEFRLKIAGDTLKGFFVNHQRVSNQVIRCEAVYGPWNRLADDYELKDFSGRWSAVFDGDEPPLNVAVAEFIQSGNRVTGTFLTPTGDYRFLDGFHTDGRSVELSAFDGSHVFYFTATFDAYDTLRGHYYSGTHWHDTWKAWRNKDATLPDADSLAFLKDGFTGISFTFPDADSQLVSLGDARFKGKVVLVQIMGSWCPNCMDEAVVLAPFYERYRTRGLEIIGLDFERTPSFHQASGFIKKFQKHFSIDYPILFAGTTDRKLRAQAIPQLREIVGFPTLIYIDRKGVVRKIHTGFSGPATGIYFEKWKDDFYRFMSLLLNEK